MRWEKVRKKFTVVALSITMVASIGVLMGMDSKTFAAGRISL
ncbi:hypothetical protein J2T13_000053 [Paenibacillus sp. DS2015]